MLRAALHDKVSTILVDPSLLGDLRPKRALSAGEEVPESRVEEVPSSSPSPHSISTFDISNQHLSVELASAMCGVFQANPGVRYINFSGSNIVDRQEYMGKIMSCPRLRLHSLNLSFCKLGGGVAIKELAAALLRMSSPIEELSLVGNDLTSQDIQDLSPWLETNTSLKLLDIGMNQKVRREGLVVLTQALARAGHPLLALGLSGTGLNDEALDALSQLVLDEKFKVEFLDISWNTLSITGPGLLVSIIGKAKTVREVHCMAMKLSPEALRKMADSYRGNHTIEVLHLASNYIDMVSVDHIVGLLQECTNLRWLDMVSNNFGSPTFISIIEPAVNAARHLTILSLSNCGCNDESGQLIANMLSKNTRLLELHMNFNTLTDAGAFAIAACLKNHNKTLRNLRLDENEIGSDGVQALLEALGHNNSLASLDLSENDFDPAQFENASYKTTNPDRIVKFVPSE